MLRSLYAAGTVYAVVCLLAIVLAPSPARLVAPPGAGGTTAVDAGTFAGTGGAAWFARVRPHCNPVEAEVQLRESPPPASAADGPAYAAACYALAGKIDRARATIDALPEGRARGAAASVVFEVGHPVADAGDNEAAGPIMRLVVEYQPENYMALYHAGMAEYALGHADVARDLLRRFQDLYRANDGWNASAREALDRLGPSGQPRPAR